MTSRYSIDDLLRIMAQLRAPNGCPWDKEQTHESILSCLVEESFEFIDAVERKDIPNMSEELGDILLQVVFHSQMAQEAGTFTMQDVVHGIAEKLVRRHPHVFGEATANDSDAVMVQWEAIKAQEKTQLASTSNASNPIPESLLGQIPRGLPPMAKALKIQKRVAKVGFDWHNWQGSFAKVQEELAEFEAEIKAFETQKTAELRAEPISDQAQKNTLASRAMAGEYPTPDQAKSRMEAEFGDMLFAMINLSRHLEIDPERALSLTSQRFANRFQTMENLAREAGHEFEKLELDAKEMLWQQAKRITQKPDC